MAVDLYSDSSSSVGISPRISFSHDFPSTDGVPVPIEQYIRSASPSSSVDFDFCVFDESFDHESCSADEIFSDGKILPVEIKRKLVISAPKMKKTEATPPMVDQMQKSKRTTTAAVAMEVNCESEMQKSTSSKSFWGFKRSSSLNCGNGYARTLCPIPLLSRSNSTGSTSTAAANGKRSTGVKENCPSRFRKSSSTSSSEKSLPPAGGNHQKPPLKKSYGPSYGGGGNGNGVKISPVINVPTHHMFGLGSIFSSSRDNKNKKR